MSRASLEFAVWALILLAASAGIIMYQHARHSAAIVAAISGAALAGAGTPTAPQPDSPASGVLPPVSPSLGFDTLELGSLGSLGA